MITNTNKTVVTSFFLATQIFSLTNHENAIYTSAFTVSSPSLLLSTTPTAPSKIPRTKLQMTLEPLAKEGEWTAYLDEENTGLIYYFNTITGESSWDPPTSTFPNVKISKWKEEKMVEKRKQYNEKLENFYEEDDKGGNNGNEGFFGNFLSVLTAEKPSSTVGVTEEEEISMGEESTSSGDDDDDASSSTPATPFFNLFGSSSKPNGVNGGTSTEEKPNGLNGTNGINGSSSTNGINGSLSSSSTNGAAKTGSTNGESTNGASTSTNNFFNNFFSGSSTTSTTPATTTDEIYTEQSTEEEFYDQMQFEDAVLVEEVPEIPTPIKLEIASKVMPHPEKVSWGGEDALFVSGKSFGVFDGVSGAEKLDGVPLYSNTLAQKLKSSVGKEGLSIDEIKAKMLKAAEYADMAATGASTAVVASIGDDDILRVVNLGDSQCYVVRDGSIAAKAKETIHYFDCPFQLSDESPDRPRNGSVLQTPIQKGDVIIAGSDGVFDNLGDLELLEIVESNNNGSISKLAQQIVKESRKVSKDPNAPTPYAKAAKRNRYANFRDGVGGKLDDISCVVVRCK